MRLLVSAGGTGGGVYPALAVLQALEDHDDQVLWVGSREGFEEELVTRAGIHYSSIHAAGVHGVGVRSLPRNIFHLAQGFLEARNVLNSFKPDVLFFTGGYVAIPVALAGIRTPTLSFIPDVEPGLALKLLIRFSDCIATSVEDTKKYIPSHRNVHTTGYPLRRELGKWNVETARERFSLDAQSPALLVFGGSKGARSLNQTIFDGLSELLTHIQIVHIVGKLDWNEAERRKENLPGDIRKRYHPYEYLHEEIGAALKACDLVLSRAGASILGEFPHFGIPAILVPYPYAWRYQKTNADYLVAHHAAAMLKDDELPEKLTHTVLALIGNQSQLAEMRQAMKSLENPGASERIADLLKKIAKDYSRKSLPW